MKEIKYEDGRLFSVRGKTRRELKAKSLCNGRQYITLRIGGRRGKTIYAHRHIWEMFNGTIPSGFVIDHINGNGLDNKIENLQCVSQRENCEKQGIRSDNKTGTKGVYFCQTRKKFVVDFSVRGKRFMKRFSEKEEALRFRASIS